MMVRNTNDGSQKAPCLRLDINYNTCNALTPGSGGYHDNDRDKHRAIKEAGFEGIQDGDPLICRELGLGLTAHARINQRGELTPLIDQWKDHNCDCATVHLGWGMESDAEMDGLVSDVIENSVKNNFPVYIEIHRATITQDMQRTVSMVSRFPEVRFNGDFSHWYTGQEMVYGGIEEKWEFIAPVFERVRFLHGRIANPGSIQVDVGDGNGLEYVEHFREMWTRSFLSFLKTACPGDFICFAVELLPADIYYARTIKDPYGENIEEGDRWEQALLYRKIAAECWEEAMKRLPLGLIG